MDSPMDVTGEETDAVDDLAPAEDVMPDFSVPDTAQEIAEDPATGSEPVEAAIEVDEDVVAMEVDEDVAAIVEAIAGDSFASPLADPGDLIAAEVDGDVEAAETTATRPDGAWISLPDAHDPALEARIDSLVAGFHSRLDGLIDELHAD